jgi:EAL domain-containing protein (putative c-di-GMP-specific phosphodiesterase class I)
VIAEGAESEEDALQLEQIGCDFAQGYIFGRPATASAVLRAIRSNAKTVTVEEPAILGMINRLKGGSS